MIDKMISGEEWIMAATNLAVIDRWLLYTGTWHGLSATGARISGCNEVMAEANTAACITTFIVPIILWWFYITGLSLAAHTVLTSNLKT